MTPTQKSRAERLAEAYNKEHAEDIHIGLAHCFCYNEGFFAGYLSAEERAKKLVRAVRNWKKQVDEHGGDYLPGNYKQMIEALKDWEDGE